MTNFLLPRLLRNHLRNLTSQSLLLPLKPDLTISSRRLVQGSAIRPDATQRVGGAERYGCFAVGPGGALGFDQRGARRECHVPLLAAGLRLELGDDIEWGGREGVDFECRVAGFGGVSERGGEKFADAGGWCG